jgi:hypothetical protein
MIALLLIVCAALLAAVFVRLGQIAKDIAAVKASVLPMSTELAFLTTAEERADPMRAGEGPRSLAEMQLYFRNAEIPHNWNEADPGVARRYDEARVRREKGA